MTTEVGAALPGLPCPECKARGISGTKGGGHRVGHRRSQCTTCNNFTQNVMRLTRKELKARHEDEYLQIRIKVEASLYPQVIEDWERDHPTSTKAYREFQALLAEGDL